MTASLSAFLDDAARRLTGASESPRLDAELLLAHALGKPRSHLRAHPESVLVATAAAAFERLVAARLAGEPIAHLTSEREFWSLPLKVSPATLIPRPETELLVELALTCVAPDAALAILDLGTGSGAIALALAHERPRARLTAVDQSAAALQVARENAGRLGLKDMEFLEGSWFEPVASRRFHLIVSNPPYIREGDPHLAQGDLRFEPRRALASGADGLEALRHIIQMAPPHMHAGAKLFLEHGHDQGEAVRRLLQTRGFVHVATHQDLAGHERVSRGDWVNVAASG